MSGFLKPPLIKLQLGPSTSTGEVLVHKDILTTRSKYVANALSERWNGSNDKTINLHDLLPRVAYKYFKYYLEVLYKDSTIERTSDSNCLNICYIYIIAEALLDIETRNLAVKTLYFRMREKKLYPVMKTVAMVYDHTVSAANPIRRLLVDVWYDKSQPTWYEGFQDAPPDEFLWDLALKNASRSKNQTTPIEYNIHEFMDKTEKELAVHRSVQEGTSDVVQRRRVANFELPQNTHVAGQALLGSFAHARNYGTGQRSVCD